jgi:excisionase family DNA binding protein
MRAMIESLPISLPAETVELIAHRAAELVLEQLAERIPNDTARYLTVREASKYLSLSEAALRHAIARGQIGGVIQEDIGHRIRVDRHELDRFLAQRSRA